MSLAVAPIQKALIALILAIILLVCLTIVLDGFAHGASFVNERSASAQSPQPTMYYVRSPVTITVDDFEAQPYPGAGAYFYNRLDGDRGALNNAGVDWGSGVVTLTIAPGASWGGLWFSLNHPIIEAVPVNFSALLPTPIKVAYQSQITEVVIQVESSVVSRTLHVELKQSGDLRWRSPNAVLTGDRQTIAFPVSQLAEMNELVLVLDNAAAGDTFALDSIVMRGTTPLTDAAEAGFLWSYGMLLHNWNPTTGLVRDNAKFASGVFDAVPATGALAAVTALAHQLGYVSRPDAIQLVNRISETLLLDLPTTHGLWPHWVITTSEALTIAPGAEWSSVDTVIAAIALLDAQAALGLDTSGAETVLKSIDWMQLEGSDGISHGFTQDGAPIQIAWDTFGGETWLVALAYSLAQQALPPQQHPLPPTANGSGFIDELAWLLAPPPRRDVWGADWNTYRGLAAITQTTYYTPETCFGGLGLFGLSAAEVPEPARVSPWQIYQAFGVGGRDAQPNDGSHLLGAPVVVPHEASLIAALQPESSVAMWAWLIDNGYFSPLNNVESLYFPDPLECVAEEARWNHLRGSWNLALQTLGWGRYLAQRSGESPILWHGVTEISTMRAAYARLVPAIYLPFIFMEYSPDAGPLMPTAIASPGNTATATSSPTATPPPTATATHTPDPAGTSTSTQTPTNTSTSPPTNTPTSTSTLTPTPTSTPTPTPTHTPTSTSSPTPWQYARECENPTAYTVGRTIPRSNASGNLVHGQFGTLNVAGYPAQAGDVTYSEITTVKTDNLWLQLRYSKASIAGIPILFFIDDEAVPRASIIPSDQGNWDRFAWTAAVDLGAVEAGAHTVRFYTEGQQYGVADLDRFALSIQAPQ